jgi:hypothetical protein
MSSKGLCQELQAKETVPTALHGYADIFSEMAFDVLPQYGNGITPLNLSTSPHQASGKYI